MPAPAPLLCSSTGLPLSSLCTWQEQPWLLLEGLRAMRLLLVLPESAKTAHRAGQQNRASRLDWKSVRGLSGLRLRPSKLEINLSV